MTDDEYEKLTDEQKRARLQAAEDVLDALDDKSAPCVWAGSGLHERLRTAFKPPSPLPSDRALSEVYTTVHTNLLQDYPWASLRRASYAASRALVVYTLREVVPKILDGVRVLTAAEINRACAEAADEMDARSSPTEEATCCTVCGMQRHDRYCPRNPRRNRIDAGEGQRRYGA